VILGSYYIFIPTEYISEQIKTQAGHLNSNSNLYTHVFQKLLQTVSEYGNNNNNNNNNNNSSNFISHPRVLTNPVLSLQEWHLPGLLLS